MQPPFPAPVTEWHNDTYDAINPSRPELSQAGKNIIITGAGSGIGREIAHAFAEAGADSIHILGRTKQTLEETQALVKAKYPNAKFNVHVADILDASALDKAARKIGYWDVLVANAGYIPKPDLIEASDPDEWWKTFEVSFLPVHFMSFQKLTLVLSDQHQRQLYSRPRVSSI
jgi:NADP-dependent 3-hydroxy acid dehydrogenase YdfG